MEFQSTRDSVTSLSYEKGEAQLWSSDRDAVVTVIDVHRRKARLRDPIRCHPDAAQPKSRAGTASAGQAAPTVPHWNGLTPPPIGGRTDLAQPVPSLPGARRMRAAEPGPAVAVP